MMNGKQLTRFASGASVLLAGIVFAIFLLVLIGTVTVSAEKGDGGTDSEVVFQPAGGLGAIPDGGACGAGPAPGTPRNVTFNVTGITGAPTSVSVSFGLTHSFVGDIVAILIAPNGAQHSIFGRTGSTTTTGTGFSSDLSGTYTFTDAAASSWWTTAAVNPVAGGYYRTSNSGGAGATNPMPATNMTAAFAGVANANGTWTLRFTDGCSADTGSVTSARLFINSLAINGPNDVTGDGRSDFTIVRADGPPSLSLLRGVNDYAGRDKVGNMKKLADAEAPDATGVGWYSASNSGTFLGRQSHGVNTDFFMIADMVGGPEDDLVVWTPGTLANFKILDSGNFTLTTRQFGTTNDNPTALGDFNGDGKTDLVVYRDGTAGSPQSYFYWASVTDPAGSFNAIPWGTTGDIAFTLDMDGDGKSDPAIQRNGGGGNGVFYVLRSTSGAFGTFWGRSSDFVVPGDYDGDGRDDLCVSRNADFGTGNYKYFFTLPSNGGNPIYLQWGLPGDTIIQGDYDLDGRTDIGVWRSSATPGATSYYVNKSGGGFQSFAWGQAGDYPVNNWNVH